MVTCSFSCLRCLFVSLGTVIIFNFCIYVKWFQSKDVGYDYELSFISSQHSKNKDCYNIDCECLYLDLIASRLPLLNESSNYHYLSIHCQFHLSEIPEVCYEPHWNKITSYHHQIPNILNNSQPVVCNNNQIVWKNNRKMHEFIDYIQPFFEYINYIKSIANKHPQNKYYHTTVNNQSFNLNIFEHHSGISVVMNSYRRIDTLLQSIDSILGCWLIESYHIIWHNLHQLPPYYAINEIASKYNKKIDIHLMNDDTLSNRFYPYSEIKSHIILNMDDDWQIGCDGLFIWYIMFHFYPTIIGSKQQNRVIYCDNTSTPKYWNSYWKPNAYHLILTNIALTHKCGYFAFFQKWFKDIRQFITDNLNGEDIAINYLFSAFANLSPTMVDIEQFIVQLNSTTKEEHSGIHNQELHIEKRNAMIASLVKNYGYYFKRSKLFIHTEKSTNSLIKKYIKKYRKLIHQ